jgi:hypothetical protein
MSTSDFTDRKFQEKRTEHEDIPCLPIDDFKKAHGNPDDEKFDWEYFGLGKFGRYAVCKNTNLRRKLTMGEFYGNGIVD